MNNQNERTWDLDGVAIRMCPRCAGYMKRRKIDWISKHLLGAKGRWYCMKCEAASQLGENSDKT